jgi:nicotinamidase-related amidase
MTDAAHILGNPPNHWVYLPPSSTSPNPTFDLTRQPVHSPYQPPSAPTLSLTTLPIPLPSNPKSQNNILLDPSKTALVIIDMQNFFLSPALGRDPTGPGHKALEVLEELVPSCRDKGIQIIWCNWGLTEEDIRQAPAAVLKGFGALNAFRKEDVQANIEGEKLIDTKPAKIYKGFGTPMGDVTLEDGTVVVGGKLLMPDQWNSNLPPRLQAVYDTELDFWAHKTRMSGLHTDPTMLSRYLRQRGLRTLLFAGVNTDQCVQGTMVDAYNNGWDCVMVTDACGTGTPGGKDVAEWNMGRSWGFLVDSEGIKLGLSNLVV